MAEAPKKSSRFVDTWKMKKWYKIMAPLVLGSQQIGETVAVEDSQLIGRTVTISLMAVTGDVKKQSTDATFEITEVKNGNAETKLTRLEIVPSSVRRIIKKGKDRVDLSVLCATKDNVVLRLKPLIITRAHTGGIILTNIRKLVDAILRIESSKLSYDALIQDILSGRLQKAARQRVNKIYPLKSFEMRAVEVTETSKPLPPIPVLEEIKEEVLEETEEEKIEKKVHGKKETVDNIEITDVTEQRKEEKAKEENKEEKHKKAKKEE